MTGPGGDLPFCARCGERLGVYELLRWLRPDGSLLTCGWLQAREHAEHADPRSAFFHCQCAPADD